MNLDNLGLDNISGDICLVLEEEGDTSLAGSQAGSVAGSQARTGDWELLERFDTQIELLDFLYQYSFKMVVTHGNQTSKCPLHIEKHSQSYGYYSCSSVRCHKVPEDKCFFRLRVCI